MKIGGVDPSTLQKIEILVLPRGEDHLVFKAKGLDDYEEFEKLCPEPQPPGKLTREGWVPNEDDPNYQSVRKSYNEKRWAWITIQSLAPSDIEWDTVDLSNPATWTHWQKDLKAAGLSQVEVNRVGTLVAQANCLDEGKLKQARDVFLLGQAQVQRESSGHLIAPPSSPSGEPAQG